MVIGICTCSRAEYEEIAGWAKDYGRANGISVATQWFASYEEYARSFEKEPFPITFLSFDDIVNQELAIVIRGVSRAGQMVWLGNDRRFGVSSYRVNAANFLLKPAAKEDVWDSMERCIENMNVRPGPDRENGGTTAPAVCRNKNERCCKL